MAGRRRHALQMQAAAEMGKADIKGIECWSRLQKLHWQLPPLQAVFNTADVLLGCIQKEVMALLPDTVERLEVLLEVQPVCPSAPGLPDRLLHTLAGPAEQQTSSSAYTLADCCTSLF